MAFFERYTLPSKRNIILTNSSVYSSSSCFGKSFKGKLIVIDSPLPENERYDESDM